MKWGSVLEVSVCVWGGVEWDRGSNFSGKETDIFPIKLEFGYPIKMIW